MADCPYRIHKKAGLHAAKALVMLIQAQIDEGRLVLRDTGLDFGQIDVVMTEEQFIKFALDAIESAIKGDDCDRDRPGGTQD